MTEYSIKIMNLRDLIKFEKYVYTNHRQIDIFLLQSKHQLLFSGRSGIQDNIYMYAVAVLRNYTVDIHSILGIAIAIPMDSATVSLKDCPESLADGFPLLCQ